MGGDTMKDHLENIAKSSGSAEDALKAFSETGMSLKDINVNGLHGFAYRPSFISIKNTL